MYRQKFKDIEDLLHEIDPSAEIVNPAEISRHLPKMEHRHYMQIDLILLSTCDSIYMLPGWEHSKGARTEYNYAKRKGLIIICQATKVL